ncbi:MAG: dihydroorotase [Deltaproteobacteria bacterium]|nr:dihydroorotase [Deltaproteobacteria bacterium]MBW1987067.1 dihydroorotase [Deltaproteobacteria bacterium]
MGLVIKGGLVVDPSQNLEAPRDLLIDAGKVAALELPGVIPAEGHQLIEAQNLVVSPGLIDMHVHFREPGEEYKETIASGGQAAARGGFTAVATMPNTQPVNDCAAVTSYILAQARRAAGPRVYPVAAISQGSRGEKLAEYGDLQEAGAVALSDDGRPVMNPQLMRRALEYARTFGMLIIAHCEDLHLSGSGVMHEGLVSLQMGLLGIPAAAEEVMVFRDLTLARLTGGRLHVAHVSTAGSVALIRQAKKQGLAVTAETAPHYFSLTDEAVRGFNTNAKMYPPLRQAEDVAAIVEGLADGTIDCIASDHAPHSSLEKEVEFALAAKGIIGLETSLGLTLRLVQEGAISLMTAIERLSTAPARILGIPGGSLAPGGPADVTLIDPNRAWLVDIHKFKSKSRNSPFHGWQLPGQAVMTMVGGKIIYSEGVC